MTRRKWDGSFAEAQYVETGNLVNDVIQNGGRLLHEPTVDGYTHEIVDRGTYISDDYYFPQKETGKKSHIHYEIRSTGSVLIDGNKVVTKIMEGRLTMRHGKQLSKNRSLDGTIIKEESDNKVQEGEMLHKLGEKFKSDKETLESEIEKVKDSIISDEDKREIIAQLEIAIEKLQEQYDQDVTAEEERLQQELMEQTESMQEAADEFDRQADDLRGVKMEAASTDMSSAAEAAEAKKQSFEQMKAEYVDKLNLQIEQANIQRRNIRKRRLSGR